MNRAELCLWQDMNKRQCLTICSYLTFSTFLPGFSDLIFKEQCWRFADAHGHYSFEMVYSMIPGTRKCGLFTWHPNSFLRSLLPKQLMNQSYNWPSLPLSLWGEWWGFWVLLVLGNWPQLVLTGVAARLFFFFFWFQPTFFKKIFIVIQLQLYAFSPHPSTPPQLNPPPSPPSTLPLDFVHVSFIVVRVIPSPHCPLPTPPWPLLDCS